MVAIFRFSKLDRVISTPGLHYVIPGYEMVMQSTQTQTYRIHELKLNDCAGNPIVISGLLEYSIFDPASLYIATRNNLQVLTNSAEQVLRNACTTLPLLGEHGHDIRSQVRRVPAL